MTYDYGYKHLIIKLGPYDMIIELSIDNSQGEKTFSAKSNYLFQDEYGDWGHACGVGKNEESALKMCLDEIYQFCKIEVESIQEHNIPKRITVLLKNEAIILYLKQCENGIVLLSKNGQILLEKQTNILEYIDNNLKNLKKNGTNKLSEPFFKDNGFYPLFENLSVKYKIKNDISLNH